MLSRPLSPAELTAIAAYLEQSPVTICPPTGRGVAIPHLGEESWQQERVRWYAERVLPKSHTSAPAGSESRRNAA